MDRIDNVDLRDALLDIARNNTFYHMEHDLNISIEQMERAARLEDPAEKMMVWVSYPSGIDCYSERQAFQKGTRDYNGIQFHANDMKRDRKLAYAVEVTGFEDGKVHGNLFQMDIAKYAETVRQSALVSQTMRIYTDSPRDNHKQIIMPKDEYDRRYPLDLPKMTYYRNEPDDLPALQSLLDTAAKEREAACAPCSLWLHTSNLYDDRLTFYSGQLLGDIGKLREPNTPDRKGFSVPLHHVVAASYDPEQLRRLLEALPYESAMFAVQRGQWDMRLVVPREEVMRQRQPDMENLSVLARLQEGKKAATQVESTPRAAPKHNIDKEV